MFTDADRIWLAVQAGRPMAGRQLRLCYRQRCAI
jgi:hypothetical protein